MTEYPAGSAKQDPVTGSIALRTSFPDVEPLTQHAWLVATPGSGAVNKTSLDVESWTDVTLPHPPAPLPAPTA